MIELRRIPNTQDLLAAYEVELKAGDSPELIGYKRLGRFRRDESAIEMDE